MDWSSAEIWIGAAVSAAAEQAQGTGRALMLWVILAGGLLVFFLVLALVAVSRRAARRSKPETPSADLDAWKAAADRMENRPPPHQP